MKKYTIFDNARGCCRIAVELGSPEEAVVDILIIETDPDVRTAAINAVKSALRKHRPNIVDCEDLIVGAGFIASPAHNFKIIICSETVYQSEGAGSRGNGLEFMTECRSDRAAETFIILANTNAPAEQHFHAAMQRPAEPEKTGQDLHKILSSLYTE